jgi:hypothetical protein
MTDDVDFNDPAGWGYCKYCAFLVAVVPGVNTMVHHSRRSGDWAIKACKGNGLFAIRNNIPTEAPQFAFDYEQPGSFQGLTNSMNTNLIGPAIAAAMSQMTVSIQAAASGVEQLAEAMENEGAPHVEE